MKPSEAPFQAMKNRKNLKGSCGCFKCLEIFDVNEIKEWTDNDQTAICPKCNADSVLPETDNLEAINKHWFKKDSPSS